MRRYLAHFPASTIRLLLADREFIGADWLKFLNDNNIPFAIRLRENLRVTTEDGHDLTLYARLRLARRTRISAPGSAPARTPRPATLPCSNFAAKRLKDEWLIVVSNVAPRTALAAYRKRWAIECLFGDAKTRGLNLEDTRLTCPRKLALLMALVALALAWAGRTAADPARPPRPQAQGARLPRPVLVPHRLRPHPKPAQIRPPRRHRRLAQDRFKATQNTESLCSVVSAFIATAFAQEGCRGREGAVAPRRRPTPPEASKLAGLMDEAEADVLAYMDFPAQHGNGGAKVCHGSGVMVSLRAE